MEKLTEFAIKNARLTILGGLCIFIVGLFTFFNMPRQEDPEIIIRNAQVTLYYPGLSTSQMEDLVAKTIEKKVKQIPEVEDIITTVKTGYALIEMKVYDRYFNLDPIWQDLRNKMQDVKRELPSGVRGPFVNDDYGLVAAVTLSLHGRGYTMKELRDVSRDLQDQLGLLENVNKVELFGIQEERIYLYINASRLAQYGLSFNKVVTALQEQNILLPGGTIIIENRRIGIEPSGNFESLEEIRNVQLKVPDTKQTIYLRDIATVKREYVDPPQQPVFYDNDPAVVLSISMRSRYNIEKFGKEVKEKVAALQAALPAGLQIDYATFQPDLVTKSINDAASNLFQTIIVVLGVVMVFLGFRTGIIVGSIVPLTIFLSLWFMTLWGIDLQRMSIAAIIIALGLLVDNGIVIAEDIRRSLDHGFSKLDSALMASKSLGLPLLTSSLTTILAFVPLAMAENSTGEFLYSLSQVIVTTLLSSWFLAVYAMPTLCYWFLEEEAPQKKTVKEAAKNKSSPYDQGFYKIYRTVLEKIIAFRYLFVLSMVGLLVVSILSFKFVTKQMLPYSDRNQLLVYVDLPAGSTVQKTVDSTRLLISWLSDKNLNPEIESNIAYIGFGGPRFYLSLSPPSPGNNVAFVIVNATSAEAVPELTSKIDRFIKSEVPEMNGSPKAMWLGSKEIGLVEYRISGPDVAKLYELSAVVEAQFKNIPGTYSIQNDWQSPVVRIKVEIDQDRASRSGVSSESIARALSAFFEGTEISDYREGDKRLPIIVRGDSARNVLNTLHTLPVPTDRDSSVPLMQVANFNPLIQPDKLMRFDQARTITVSAKNRHLQATELHNLLLPTINSLDLTGGYRVEFGGEVEGSQRANAALVDNLPFALIAILILLIWQFNSFRRPAIILLTIPLVIIGAVIGLLTMNAFLSFTAILGLYSLAGIIVNNGIVLIDRIDVERKKTEHLQEAVIKACLVRFRPILITTFTTILGLIPLAISGGALWYPMAIVIMFGLAVGSFLTLAFVPALYVMLFSPIISLKKLGPKPA